MLVFMHNSTLGLERTRMNKGIGTHPSNPPRPYARAFDKEVCSKGVLGKVSMRAESGEQRAESEERRAENSIGDMN